MQKRAEKKMICELGLNSGRLKITDLRIYGFTDLRHFKGINDDIGFKILG
jgi:hypothetical protein